MENLTKVIAILSSIFGLALYSRSMAADSTIKIFKADCPGVNLHSSLNELLDRSGPQNIQQIKENIAETAARITQSLNPEVAASERQRLIALIESLGGRIEEVLSSFLNMHRNTESKTSKNFEKKRQPIEDELFALYLAVGSAMIGQRAGFEEVFRKTEAKLVDLYVRSSKFKPRSVANANATSVNEVRSLTLEDGYISEMSRILGAEFAPAGRVESKSHREISNHLNKILESSAQELEVGRGSALSPKAAVFFNNSSMSMRAEALFTKLVYGASATITIRDGDIFFLPEMRAALYAALNRGVKVAIVTNAIHGGEVSRFLHTSRRGLHELAEKGAKIVVDESNSIVEHVLAVDGEVTVVTKHGFATIESVGNNNGISIKGPRVANHVEQSINEQVQQIETAMARARRQLFEIPGINMPETTLGSLIYALFY